MGKGIVGQKKRRKAKVRKRNLKIILLVTSFVITVLGAILYFSFLSPLQVGSATHDAAIIDGLSEDFPNPKLINDMKHLLEKAGYRVTIFNSSDVSVEFFRELPTMGYSLIIMRVHGGRIQQPMGLFIGSGIFAEPFDEKKYEREYLSGYLLKGITYVGGKEYFVITPDYVREKFEGRFPNSIVVILSCYSAWDRVLASAFFDKGASAFVGIDKKADLSYLDRLGLEFVKHFTQGSDIEEAVEKVMETVGPDPDTGAKFVCYKK